MAKAIDTTEKITIILVAMLAAIMLFQLFTKPLPRKPAPLVFYKEASMDEIDRAWSAGYAWGHQDCAGKK